nr:MAG TPA: hypothetical protein [Caudoviricetes sp.]
MEDNKLQSIEDQLRAREIINKYLRGKVKNDHRLRILFLGWEDREHGIYRIRLTDRNASTEGIDRYVNLFSTNIQFYQYLFENKHFRYDRIVKDEVHFIRQSDNEDIVFFKREDNPALFKQYKNYNAQVEIWMSSLEDWVPADTLDFAQMYMDTYLEEIEKGWQ